MIKRHQKEVDHWVDLLNTELVTRIDQNLQTLSLAQRRRQVLLEQALKDLRGPIYRIEKQTQQTQDGVSQLQVEISQIHHGLQENERQEILKWLSTEPYIAHHDEIHRKVIKDTGLWLLDHPRFLEWQRSSSSSILWLHGIPGSGKSCLSYDCEFHIRTQKQYFADSPPGRWLSTISRASFFPIVIRGRVIFTVLGMWQRKAVRTLSPFSGV